MTSKMLVNQVLRAICLIFVFAVQGCASGPNYSSVRMTLPSLSEGKARLFFYRDGLIGAGYQPVVTINGEELYRAIPGGVFSKDVSPGQYLISTAMAQGNDVVLDLKANDVVYIELHYRFGFAVYPVLVDRELGERAIQNLSYMGQR